MGCFLVCVLQRSCILVFPCNVIIKFSFKTQDHKNGGCVKVSGCVLVIEDALMSAKLDREVPEVVAAEIKEVGSAAFYRYLLVKFRDINNLSQTFP